MIIIYQIIISQIINQMLSLQKMSVINSSRLG